MITAIPDSDMAPVTEGAMMTGASLGLTDKQRGDMAEFEFCKLIRMRGWEVKHLGDGTPGFDVLATKPDVRPLLTQVKHGFLCKDPNWNSYHYKIFNEKQGKIYGPTAYDILAFYMWDRDQWLLYCRREFGNRRSTTWTPPELRKYKPSKKALEDRDPNNWELLDQVAAIRSQESLGLGQPLSDPIVNI